jgi:hypothetical protein
MAIQFDNSNAGTLTIKSPTSGAYNIVWPASNGSSGQFLQTDGAGTLSWASIGGATGFTAALNTTGTNATTNVSSLTASGGSTNQHFTFSPKATGGIIGSIPDGSFGGNTRGTNAVDLQLSRSAFNYIASGAYAGLFAGLNNSAAGGYGACVGGQTNAASSTYTSVLGGTNNVGGNQYSAVVGGDNQLNLGVWSSLLGGSYTYDRGAWMSFVFGNRVSSGSYGLHQFQVYVLGANTADATATVMVSDGNPAGGANQIVMNDNTVVYCTIRVLGYVSGGNAKSWNVTVVGQRGSGAATTSVVGSPTVTSDFASAGASTWGLAVAADTTNGCLKLTATGQAATAIRWTAVAYTTQVGF